MHRFITPESDDDIIKFVKLHSESTPKWVDDARKEHTTLKALVFGDDFHKELITRIEKIESEDRAKARKKYSKDIRDLFERVMQPRTSVFNAHGGSVHNDIKSDAVKEKLAETLKHFKGQKSIKKYLSENFFRLVDTDANGLIFMEYVDDKDIYPTYKSINDIRFYVSDGQICEILLFEPKKKQRGSIMWEEWRLVTKDKDYRIKQNGQSFTIIEKKTFQHPFGVVPAIILSDIQKMGTETRLSPLFPIIELSKDYARDKSIKTIYKFQHGFPRHWRYVKECRVCQGTGKTGDDVCIICTGTGHIQKNDVTDIQTIARPREDEQIITPDVEGFITPDIKFLEWSTTDMSENEELINATMWGTHRIKKASNETATGRFIDVQQVHNSLEPFTDNVEWVNNQLIKYVENWINGMPKDAQEFKVIWGRMYIVESPNIILEKYTESREKGDNNTILDKLLGEYLLSKYQNDPVMLKLMQKKEELEPYIHNSTKDINTWFGAKEAEKKVLFPKFWEQTDTTKNIDTLQKELDKYYIDNTNVTINTSHKEEE